MLASINPLGERSRNQRYWATVVAYVAGSTVAGAFLGASDGRAVSVLARWTPEPDPPVVTPRSLAVTA